MLSNLHVLNYRTFREFKIENLAPVNLIVGDNNSGKSSLLEAVYLLTSEDFISSLLDILDERGEFVAEPADVRFSGRQRGSYRVSYIFHGRTLKTGSEIAIRSGSSNGSYLRMYIRETDPQQKLPLDDAVIEDGSIQTLEYEHTRVDASGSGTKEGRIPITFDGLLLNRTYRPSLRKLSSTKSSAKLVTTSHLAYDALAELWDDITLTPKEDKVVEALKILEPEVDRISFTSRQTSNSGVLLRLKNEQEPIPLGSMGDGMRRILAVIASLVSVGKGTLLVDEIDTGLYHGALVDMWKLIIETARRQGGQVFATTHSWDCVQAFQQAQKASDNPEVGRLFRLEKFQDDVLAVPYSAAELDIAVKQGIEVR